MRNGALPGTPPRHHLQETVADHLDGHALATPLQVALQLVAAAFEQVRDDEEAHDWLCEVAGIRVARGFRRQLDRRAA